LEWWDWFALHIWLITSSYGIVFAMLSFMDEVGWLDRIKSDRPWIKGVLAMMVGLAFYCTIGLRHLEGGRRHGDAIGAAEPERFARWAATNASRSRKNVTSSRQRSRGGGSGSSSGGGGGGGGAGAIGCCVDDDVLLGAEPQANVRGGTLNAESNECDSYAN
jgi:uncharacterized membrane protein YgcG